MKVLVNTLIEASTCSMLNMQHFYATLQSIAKIVEILYVQRHFLKEIKR